MPQPFCLIQWLPGEGPAEVAALQERFHKETLLAHHVSSKAELRERISSWSALNNTQRLFIGAHGYQVDDHPFDGFGPEGDFMSWMELAAFLAELPHLPDSLHLGACGSKEVAGVWSAHKAAEMLPEMSLITYAENTIPGFIEAALGRSLDDSGWDPFVFLDAELPRLREAAGPVIHMYHPNRNKRTRRDEFIDVEMFEELVGVTFKEALQAQGSRPARAAKSSRSVW